MNVEEMLAREAIRYTMSVYNSAGDRGRMDEMMTAFAEDGSLEVQGAVHTGREAIKQNLLAVSGVEERRGRFETGQKVFLRHNLSTSRIEMHGPTEADAWTYFFVITEAGLTSTGLYVDQYVKAGDRWLIKYRRVRTDASWPGQPPG